MDMVSLAVDPHLVLRPLEMDRVLLSILLALLQPLDTGNLAVAHQLLSSYHHMHPITTVLVLSVQPAGYHPSWVLLICLCGRGGITGMIVPEYKGAVNLKLHFTHYCWRSSVVRHVVAWLAEKSRNNFYLMI